MEVDALFLSYDLHLLAVYKNSIKEIAVIEESQFIPPCLLILTYILSSLSFLSNIKE